MTKTYEFACRVCGASMISCVADGVPAGHVIPLAVGCVRDSCYGSAALLPEQKTPGEPTHEWWCPPPEIIEKLPAVLQESVRGGYLVLRRKESDPEEVARLGEEYASAMSRIMNCQHMKSMKLPRTPLVPELTKARFGVESALIDSSACAAILLDKGVCTAVEYRRVLAAIATQRADTEEEKLGVPSRKLVQP